MDESADLDSNKKVGRRSGAGENTVARILRAKPEEPSPNLDSLDAIAKVFDLEAWQLLSPGMGVVASKNVLHLAHQIATLPADKQALLLEIFR